MSKAIELKYITKNICIDARKEKDFKCIQYDSNWYDLVRDPYNFDDLGEYLLRSTLKGYTIYKLVDGYLLMVNQTHGSYLNEAIYVGELLKMIKSLD